MASRIDGDLHVKGALTAAEMTLPSGTVLNASITAAAGVSASKLEHQHFIPYAQADGSDIVGATVPIYTCRGVTATIVAVQVVCVDAPDGGDKAFTVDIHKYDEGTPTPATVLSAPIAYSSTQNDGEVESGTITGASLVVGDSLLAIIAVSGSTGTQGQGLGVNVTIREDAE